MGLGTEGRTETAPAVPVEYERLASSIRELVHRLVPLGATVAVVTRGDDVLLQLGRRSAVHFPQDEDGKWAGYHPEDSDAAIQMLERAREEGAEYFLLPSTSYWWLEYYRGLKNYLETRYRVIEQGEECWLVQLSEGTDLTTHSVPAPGADTEPMVAGTSVQESTQPLREVISGLLPEDARIGFLGVAGASSGLHGVPAGLLQADLADPDAAIEQIKKFESGGTQFLVVPDTLFDWLDDHPEVRRYLYRHRFITKQDHLCEIYELLAAKHDATPNARRKPSLRESKEKSTTRSSFREVLRRILLPSRRNGKRS